MSGRPEWRALSGGVREVLALFEERAPELRFPGVDFDLLQGLVSQVGEAAEQSAAARGAYESAQQEHRDLELALTELAQTAYSYAQVYSLGDAQLRQQLAEFELATPGKARGRKRSNAKTQPGRAGNPSLPFSGAEARPSLSDGKCITEGKGTTEHASTEIELDEEALAALHVA